MAEGEWRDYAIDFTPAKAVFSIYRRTSEVPLFRVEKDPSLARRQGAYAVVAATGLILKRGSESAAACSRCSNQAETRVAWSGIRDIKKAPECSGVSLMTAGSDQLLRLPVNWISAVKMLMKSR